MSFAADLQTHLDRLSAAGWNRDQIAKPTGYTDRQIRVWATGTPCKPALQAGLLLILSKIKGRPPGPSKDEPVAGSLYAELVEEFL
jgi:hypothetical protein